MSCSVLRMHNLSLEDWFEALCRVAVIKALPTDDEVQAASAIDAGDFIPELKESPLGYDELVAHPGCEHISSPWTLVRGCAHPCAHSPLLARLRAQAGGLRRGTQRTPRR